jgi:hypothetical protein
LEVLTIKGCEDSQAAISAEKSPRLPESAQFFGCG